jgi:hypothetical protein
MTKNLDPLYESLIDDLSQDRDDRYLDYLRSKPRTWVHRNLIFDGEQLDRYYNCLGCRERKPKAFCCRGYDVELTAHDRTMLTRELPAVIAANPRLARALGDGPCWRRGDDFELRLKRKRNEECIFLQPGGRGCYLHGHALATGRDPLELKPYICSLYPVVVIVIEDQVVITTFNDESQVILETGDGAASCSQAKGRPEHHAVLLAEPILTRMFGAKVIAQLKSRLGLAPGKRKSGRK